jgi:hypothetical protein
MLPPEVQVFLNELTLIGHAMFVPGILLLGAAAVWGYVRSLPRKHD